MSRRCWRTSSKIRISRVTSSKMSGRQDYRRSRTLVLLALLCLNGSSAFGLQQSGSADEKDCTVGNPQPIIAKAKDVVVIRKEPREVVEQLQLSKEIKAEITQAGCAHYGLKMAFTFPAAKSSAANNAEAIRLLRLLKPRVTLSGPVDEAIAILTKHKNDAIEDGQPLQDPEFEMVTLYVTSETKGNKRLLVVTYSSTL